MNKPNEEYQEKINAFALALYYLIEKNQHLPPYEVAHRMIADGVRILLSTVPNNNYILSFDTVLKCLETGIEEFKEFHQKEEKN